MKNSALITKTETLKYDRSVSGASQKIVQKKAVYRFLGIVFYIKTLEEI